MSDTYTLLVWDTHTGKIRTNRKYQTLGGAVRGAQRESDKPGVREAEVYAVDTKATNRVGRWRKGKLATPGPKSKLLVDDAYATGKAKPQQKPKPTYTDEPDVAGYKAMLREVMDGTRKMQRSRCEYGLTAEQADRARCVVCKEYGVDTIPHTSPKAVA